VRCALDVEHTAHTSDVYVLDQWPCRNVELVAWVVGVDHKEKTMALTCELTRPMLGLDTAHS
jgi:hypothetical protein